MEKEEDFIDWYWWSLDNVSLRTIKIAIKWDTGEHRTRAELRDKETPKRFNDFGALWDTSNASNWLKPMTTRGSEIGLLLVPVALFN